jgi:hypothetical protein
MAEESWRHDCSRGCTRRNETDKAQMDFEFQEDGVLAKILKESGEKEIAVGSVS